VSNGEYEAATEWAEEMKARILEATKTAHDVTAVRDHFPFDDFDEDA
jgi:predicted small metal-binding protein